MTTVSDFHLKAMDLADEAFRLLRSGENDRAQLLFLQALRLEIEAASLLAPSEESEPSRSILYASAASLAFNAGDYDTAERLVAHGLSGFPPNEIREELKNLYETINSKRQLQTQGMVAKHTQDEINYGQRRINYELCQVDMKVIEALRSILDTLKAVRESLPTTPQLNNVDFSMVDAAIAKADETIKNIVDMSDSAYPN